ncbi:hypothetical protein Scep_026006 [Stephania cephalantha]|uniref:F-box domain-containing protein n=1 Tax=Stephania cephalantha TaxID=152367 RepID=A0AAP0EMJ1_9MAGN
MSGGGGILERYRSLGVGESLLRPYDYPWACKEVGFILRSAYANLPKTLQHLLFQHTLAAFRLLPKVQTQSGMAAVTILLQAAEVAFPKQKRVLAVTEYKHAVVAYKRNCKNQQVEEESADLPQDILVQIFSLLDMRSFLTAGLVCWSWNAASNDEKLWQLQYDIFFGSSSRSSESQAQMCKLKVNAYKNQSKKCADQLVISNWKEEFKRAYIGWRGNSLRISNRGYCGHCKSIVWLSNMRCSSKHEYQQIRLASPQQVVEYLLADSIRTVSSSDSDSDTDSDEGPSYKLWAYGKCIGVDEVGDEFIRTLRI